MTYPIDIQERRRSQRIPQSVPLCVRWVDSPLSFTGNLNTVEVSRHGCVLHALRPFPRGTELRLDLLHGHRACRPLRPDRHRHAPDDMDCRAGTRQTRRHLDGEAAVTRLGQDPGAVAEQRESCFRFQQRYRSREPVLIIRSTARPGKEKGGPRGREDR